MKKIKIAVIGTPSDYINTLLPIIISNCNFSIEWTGIGKADLLIYGPFFNSGDRPFRWLPRNLRPIASNLFNKFNKNLYQRKYKPITLFHTAENIRPDSIKTNYSISFDLAINSKNHYRLPYWMEMIDWTHEGIFSNANPRYGELLSLKVLSNNLGNSFLLRGKTGAFISSHLREPRLSIYEYVKTIIKIDGYGPQFNKDIKNHHESGFLKKELLKNYSFNLCPENGIYPGYVTEKIPEAFHSGCLPISWLDENCKIDFNPNAFINLAPMTTENYEPLKEILGSEKKLLEFSEQPLLLKQPSIEPFKDFVKNILNDARP